MVTMDEVRAFAATLPRSSEAFVRGRVKFRVGRIVYLAFSRASRAARRRARLGPRLPIPPSTNAAA